MHKVLVTGGAGFVGSHLCERLVAKGNKVFSLDNYFTGSADNHVHGVEYYSGHTKDIVSVLGIQEFDYIYHLGEYSRVEQSFMDFERVWEYNILGTKAVLSFAAGHVKKPKLIYAGSSTKFVPEDPSYTQSPYAWSKAHNTEFVRQFCDWNNIPFAITYFYNVYGPREISSGKYATLIAKYKNLMLNGELLPIVAPGTQTRNFTHIDDIVDALVMIGEHGSGDGYGIGNPQEYSIREVADLFGGEVLELPARKGNRMSAPVLSGLTQGLGWRPRRSLTDYVEQLKENNWK